jgi:hypothetical protein
MFPFGWGAGFHARHERRAGASALRAVVLCGRRYLIAERIERLLCAECCTTAISWNLIPFGIFPILW